MMLIIMSGSYYLSLYQYDHDISQDANLSIIQELEELSSHDIIKKFYDLDNNPELFDYVMDYMEFSSKNYIFRNGCIDSVLKHEKIKELLKINPFEAVNFISYVDFDHLLITERFIQEFIDLYDSSRCCLMNESIFDIDGNTNDEEDEIFDQFLIEIFRNKVSEYFEEDEEKIHTFYSYIFSNIYETLTVLIKKDKEPEKKYQRLVDLFNSCNCRFEELYAAFMKNDEIAFMLIDFFINTNDDIFEEDLIMKREDYIKVGDIDILRELNPYYDEENIVFEQIKQKTKEYHD